MECEVNLNLRSQCSNRAESLPEYRRTKLSPCRNYEAVVMQLKGQTRSWTEGGASARGALQETDKFA